MKSTCLFFLNSPKRNKLLIQIVTRHHITEASKRSPLIDLCKTRWAARHHAYQHFYQCFKYIIMSYEVIAFGLHHNILSDDYISATWDTESKSKANSLLNGIANFVVFLTIYQFLSHLAGITIKLQSTTLDIIKAHDEIDKSIRDNISQEFKKIYVQAERMGCAINVEPSKSRSCSRQTHRPNVAAVSIEDLYEINVAIPFIDHIITELTSQFSQLAK